MATINEILTQIESSSKSSNEVILANMTSILSAMADTNNCLQAKIESLSERLGCPTTADIVIVADRSELNFDGAGEANNDVIIISWLKELISELGPTEQGAHLALYSYPKDTTDGTSLSNYGQHHDLTSSGVALRIAADGYTKEIGDGRTPADQAIIAATTELFDNGRPGSEKIIILWLPRPSNFKTGYGTVATDPVIAADNARSLGYTVYVISGPEGDIPEATAIAGGADNLFQILSYGDIAYTVDSITAKLCVDSGTFVNCLPAIPTLATIPAITTCPEDSTCSCDGL
tara:strand:- start:2758 stop:3627 length:870 start_codon:yes stop_codon:yes gene_type:complete